MYVRLARGPADKQAGLFTHGDSEMEECMDHSIGIENLLPYLNSLNDGDAVALLRSFDIFELHRTSIRIKQRDE